MGLGAPAWRMRVVMSMAALVTRIISAQQIGDWYKEVHPNLTTFECVRGTGCQQVHTKVVLDFKYRPLHVRGAIAKCTNNQGDINATYCYDSENCYYNCVFEGANYTDMGVNIVQNNNRNSGLKLNMNVRGMQRNPRVYLLDEDDTHYKPIPLGVGTEFTYEVDISMVPCRLVSAVYLAEMEWDGAVRPFNPGGAAYGNGYCDAQCSIKPYYNSEVNTNKSGVCCNELDFWEGNRGGTSMGIHPCKIKGSYACTGKECLHSAEGGVCSQYGGGLNAVAYPSFYGQNKTVDTNRPFTVVTQFLPTVEKGAYKPATYPNSNSQVLTKRKRAAAELKSIRRLYLQDGQIYSVATTGKESMALIATEAAVVTKGGGFAALNGALQRGMVLAFSIWLSNQESNWPCANDNTDSGIKTLGDDMNVVFSNIRWGDLGSTFNSDGTTGFEA